ncbi:hypothetical protein ACROYT_G017903 [Oculina patagonica]
MLHLPLVYQAEARADCVRTSILRKLLVWNINSGLVYVKFLRDVAWKRKIFSFRVKCTDWSERRCDWTGMDSFTPPRGACYMYFD